MLLRLRESRVGCTNPIAGTAGVRHAFARKIIRLCCRLEIRTMGEESPESPLRRKLRLRREAGVAAYAIAVWTAKTDVALYPG